MTENGAPEQGQTDNLVELGAEKLAAMLRDKRRDEAAVRSRLKDAEAERDKLATTVQGFQGDALWSHAKDAGVVESARADLERAVPLADVLGDDGLVDAGKVSAAVQGLRETHRHYFTPPSARSGGDLSGGTGEVPAATQASWGDVIGAGTAA